MKRDAGALSPGAKVQFKTKSGVYIAGTFIRLKRKNAEVLSKYGEGGIKREFPARWNVSLGLLIPLTPEQIKLFEFP